MEERRFYLMELDSEDRMPADLNLAITKSELRRRIEMITGGDFREGDIRILLHGEGKEPEKEVCPHCFMGRVKIDGSKPDSLNGIFKKCPACKGTGIKEPDKPFPGPDDILAMRGKKPPTPTRKECGHWAHNLADAIYYGATPEVLSARLLAIPCAKEPDPDAETHDEWVKRAPKFLDSRDWRDWAAAFVRWHREEPRGEVK